MKGKDILIRLRDGLKFAIKGSVGSIAELPPSGNTDGDTFLVDGTYYVWYKDKWEVGGVSKGADGKPGLNGSDGITPTIGDNENWFLDTVDTNKPSRGRPGPQGDRGPTGLPGKDGENGLPGVNGEKGVDGKSAYQIAKDNGYTGTEQEWLESIQGGLNESGVKRVIQQSKSEVMTAFNAINPNVQISTNTAENTTGSNFTAKNSWVECSSIINTRGNSYARLYLGSTKSNWVPSLDATGSAMRVKYDDNSMIKIMDTSHDFVVNYDGGAKTLYSMRNGYHNWFTGSTGMTLETASNWALYPNDDGNMDLGTSNKKWRNLYANSTSGVSDKRDKENIDYVDMTKRKDEFLNFFKAYKPVTYQWKSRNEGDEHKEFGFIAQDVIYSDIGKLFVNDYGEKLGFSYNSYFGVVCAGLQSEIVKREEQNKLLSDRVTMLESKLEQLLNKEVM